jgi:hypothetical protein
MTVLLQVKAVKVTWVLLMQVTGVSAAVGTQLVRDTVFGCRLKCG